MAAIDRKRVTLHPLKEDGTVDPKTCLYPKTFIDGIVDRNGEEVDVATQAELDEKVSVVSEAVGLVSEEVSEVNTKVDTEVLPVLDEKQDKLISGENIKTINNQPILGEGNITVATDLSNYVDRSSKQTIAGEKTFEDTTVHNGGVVFNGDATIRGNLLDQEGNPVSLKDISFANNLENGEGNGSLVQTNVALSNIEWSSNDEAVVIVDQEGNLEAVGVGEATITAMKEGAEATCNVAVTAPSRRLLKSAGTRNAEVEEDYILDGTQTGGDSGYTTESDLTQDGIEWAIFANTTVNPWRIGGKNLDYVERPIYSKNYIAKNISKVSVYHDAISGLTVHSLELIVASDASFTNIISNETHTDILGSSTEEFNCPADKQWNEAYYKLIYTVSTGSSSTNKYIQFNHATFKVKSEPTPVVPVESIELSDSTLELESGATYDELYATVGPEEATDKSVSWASSNPEVVSVDNEGHLTAGLLNVTSTATITATTNGTTAQGEHLSATCLVTVEKQHGPAIRLSASHLSLRVGDTTKLAAKYVQTNVADGDLAIALGHSNEAHGDNSATIGSELISNYDNQVVIGKYNRNKSSTIFEVGNGTAENRSNALEVYADGSVRVYNTPSNNNDVVNKNYADNLLPSKTGNANKVLAVNSNADGLVYTVALTDSDSIEWVSTMKDYFKNVGENAVDVRATLSMHKGQIWIDLLDIINIEEEEPYFPSLTDQAGKVVKVNEDETGFEYVEKGTKLYKHHLSFDNDAYSFDIISWSPIAITSNFEAEVGETCLSISVEKENDTWTFLPFYVSFDESGTTLTIFKDGNSSAIYLQVSSVTDTVTPL